MRKQEDHWMSISDMMSALMIIFLFIAIAFMIQVKEQEEERQRTIKEYDVIKGQIYEDLYSEFKDDLQKWNAELDRKTLSIRFLDIDGSFDVGSAQLKPQYQQILNDFLPRYISLLHNEKYNNVIQEIRIEGHTSSEWYNQVGTNEAYFRNMELSQARTRSVLEYAIMMPALQDKRDWLIQKITANGLSYSQRIIENGVENMQKSRRVEFRIRTNADEKMEQLLEELKSKELKIDAKYD